MLLKNTHKKKRLFWGEDGKMIFFMIMFFLEGSAVFGIQI